MAQKRVVYDAIIVGSGAAGGVAAHVLVNKGLNVLLLEIGPKWDRNTQFYTEHSWPYEMPFRGLGKPGQYDGLRGWQYQPNSGSAAFPGFARRVEGFGASFKKEVRDLNPTRVSLAGFGECLPYFDNYCEIDPDGLNDR